MYAEVADQTVPAATRQAAREALASACTRLGLALPPQLLWVRGPITDEGELKRLRARTPANAWAPPGYTHSLIPFNGLVDTTRWAMWIRADLSWSETFITVAHECGHLAYSRGGWKSPFGSPGRAREEQDVEAFGQALYRRYLDE